MIAHAALELKDTFATRLASIKSVLDSVEILENYEVILAKFSSSCIYMLFFGSFFVMFRFCKVGQLVFMYKMSLVHLRIKPRQTCQNLHIGNYTKALIFVV